MTTFKVENPLSVRLYWAIKAVIALFYLLPQTPVMATPLSSPDRSLYELLERSYHIRDWEHCLLLADSLYRAYPRSQYLSSALIIGAEAALKMRDVERALREARLLLLRFPESVYGDRARLVVAQCYLLSEQWDEAEKMLLFLKGFTTDNAIKSQVESLLSELRAFRARERVSQREIISSGDSLRVAIILPLSDFNDARGKAFLAGFIWRWGKSPYPLPLVWDSQGDPVRAARLFKEVVRDKAILGVVGGIDEAEAIGFASLTDMLGVPFITTSYSGVGLAQLGSVVFQGRADDRKLGERLGYWAVGQGKGQVAILYPQSRYGRSVWEGFRKAIENSGGVVLAEEAYPSQSTDLISYLLNLRTRAWRIQFNDSLQAQFQSSGGIWWEGEFREIEPHFITVDTGSAGSLIKRLSQSLLDSLWNVSVRKRGSSLQGMGEGGDTLLVPVSVYQSLLIVIERGMVGHIIPQVLKVNFSTQLLGDENWGDLETLMTHLRFLEGLTFVTSYPLELPEGELEEAFGGYYSDSQLMRSFLEGERAASIALFGASRSHNRAEFSAALGLIWDLETLSGPVRFLKEERVNRTTFLYRVTREGVKRADLSP